MKTNQINREKRIKVIHYQDDPLNTPMEEVIPSITVALDVNGNIRISALVEAIKKRGFLHKVENHLISYFSSAWQCYVYLGIDPLPSDLTIPFTSDSELSFKFWPKASLF